MVSHHRSTQLLLVGEPFLHQLELVVASADGAAVVSPLAAVSAVASLISCCFHYREFEPADSAVVSAVSAGFQLLCSRCFFLETVVSPAANLPD